VRGLVGGTISLVAYSIVLWAQTTGALAPIAALRESSIVFGALLGAVFLGERMGRRRAAAAAVVVCGVVALAL
jgi:drug/metabolite transporter (DMT)-like permease